MLNTIFISSICIHLMCKHHYISKYLLNKEAKKAAFPSVSNSIFFSYLVIISFLSQKNNLPLKLQSILNLSFKIINHRHLRELVNGGRFVVDYKAALHYKVQILYLLKINVPFSFFSSILGFFKKFH